MKTLSYHRRIWVILLATTVALIGVSAPALAKAAMNDLELAMRGETKAEADTYNKSFSEGIGDTLAEVPQKNMGDPLPDAQEKAEENIEETVFKERIPAYSLSEIAAMDMTQPSGVNAEDIKIANTYSGLEGLEDAFVKAEKDHGVNCLFLHAISVVESGGGAAMFKPNNMFGYGQMSFKSKAEGIDHVAKALSENYLAEGGRYYKGKTPADVNKIYCTTDSWHSKVEKTMYNMYKKIREHNLAQYQ